MLSADGRRWNADEEIDFHRGVRVMVLLLVVLAWAAPAFGQLLYDAEERYESYARQGYRAYNSGIFGQVTRNMYDDLGNFVLDGVGVFELEEGRTNPPESGSFIDKSRFYQQYLNRLLVAQDSYGDWSSRLIVGDRIRTKFTALTLDLVALNGARWDADVDGAQFSFVTSRLDWPIFPGDNLELHGARDWATYLLGGHVQRKFGVLDLSFSYVNLHRTNSLTSWGDNSIKGVVPRKNTPPAYIVVKFGDGSPEDGGGARIYDLHIEGTLGDIRPLVTRHDSEQIDRTYPNRDRFFPLGKTIPPYIEFLRGDLAVEPAEQGEFLEANGSEFLLYWFKIPQEMRGQVERLRFRGLVANDYRIEMAEIFLPAATESSTNVDITGERATFFYPVIAAEGQVRDGSNRRWVDFEYGRHTGRTNASLRLEVQRRDFSLRTEFARTFEFRQYPSHAGDGKWQRRTADAFFVNTTRDWHRASLGFEVFRIAPQYSTSISVEDRNYRTYTEDLRSPFSVFPSFDERYNNTLELSTVDDNDDRDRFPDMHFIPNFADNDGIFPGLDLDQDGQPDPNENGNTAPDYLEPFVLYNVDPPEYDYGDDFDNNGIIDHREDDFEPDYPYDVDTQGHHLFAGLRPRAGLEFTLGRYRTRQIWGAGKNRVSYFKTAYQRSLFPYGRVEFFNVFKQVQDDIEDDTPQFLPRISNALPFEVRGTFDANVDNFELVEDELAMRNSLVNTAYLKATFFRIDNLNIDQRLKYDVNFQRPTSLQPANRIGAWSWVLRAAYNWNVGSLTVTPRIKYMGFVRRDRSDRVRPISERFFYPILTATYDLTPMTRFSAGAQGLPWLKSRYRDRVNSAVNYGAEDYVVMVTNRTTYKGYHLSLSTGYQRKQLQFDDRSRQVEDIDQVLFFMRLVMGLEPFKG